MNNDQKYKVFDMAKMCLISKCIHSKTLQVRALEGGREFKHETYRPIIV